MYTQNKAQRRKAQRQIKVGLVAQDYSLSAKQIAEITGYPLDKVRADLAALGMTRNPYGSRKSREANA